MLKGMKKMLAVVALAVGYCSPAQVLGHYVQYPFDIEVRARTRVIEGELAEPVIVASIKCSDADVTAVKIDITIGDGDFSKTFTLDRGHGLFVAPVYGKDLHSFSITPIRTSQTITVMSGDKAVGAKRRHDPRDVIRLESLAGSDNP